LWTALDWIRSCGLHWTGLGVVDCTGLDLELWTALDWIRSCGLHWTGLEAVDCTALD